VDLFRLVAAIPNGSYGSMLVIGDKDIVREKEKV